MEKVQFKRLKYLQDQSGDNPQSMQEEKLENLQDQKYENTDDEMFENIQELGDMDPRVHRMENLQDQMVENQPDQMFDNVQENTSYNRTPKGPIRIKNIFQVVKKPEQIYQTRMGKRNMVDKGPSKIYMTRMGKVNAALETPQ